MEGRTLLAITKKGGAIFFPPADRWQYIVNERGELIVFHAPDGSDIARWTVSEAAAWVIDNMLFHAAAGTWEHVLALTAEQAAEFKAQITKGSAQ